MKKLGIIDRQDIRFSSFDALNSALLRQPMDADGPVPVFEKVRIWIGSRLYYFVAEAWFEGCLEDRPSGCSTTKSNIARRYKNIMEREAGFEAEKHEYIPRAPAGTYGVTWIAKRDMQGESIIKKVNISQKS